MMPHVGLLLCLDMVKGVLHRAPERRKRRLERAPTGSTAIKLADLCADVSEFTSFHTNKNKVMTTPMLVESRQTKRRKSMYHGFYYALTVLWGLVVLAIHIEAESRGATPIPGCRLELTPWLTKNASCSVMQINCYRDDQVGSSDQIAEPLKILERSVLTKVIITRCPALEVPKILHEFPRLHTFEAFNCTITRWPRSAAFTQSYHPYLFQTLLYDTNLSAIPDGLLHDELPETFEALWIINSNISELSESIGDLWATHKWFMLRFDFTSIKRLPSAFSKLQIEVLHLSACTIDMIPDDLFASLHLTELSLSGLPLELLPQSLGDPTTLRVLGVEGTHVAKLTPWVESWLKGTDYIASFYNSPVCENASHAPYCENYFQTDQESIEYLIVAAQRPFY